MTGGGAWSSVNCPDHSFHGCVACLAVGSVNTEAVLGLLTGAAQCLKRHLALGMAESPQYSVLAVKWSSFMGLRLGVMSFKDKWKGLETFGLLPVRVQAAGLSWAEDVVLLNL